MIRWVIEGAQKSKKLGEVWVATDDSRIADVAKSSGAKVAMTDSALASGTDRIWAATQNIDCDLVVNIQGDEPLITGELIDSLVGALENDPEVEMATLAHPISAADLASENCVKVIVDQKGNGIYFSRFPIPYSREKFENAQRKAVLKHIGMYGYRKTFLGKFCAAPQAEIELAESLEQLRALFLGAKIKVVQVQERSWGVDTPADLLAVEEQIARLGENS